MIESGAVLWAQRMGNKLAIIGYTFHCSAVQAFYRIVVWAEFPESHFFVPNSFRLISTIATKQTTPAKRHRKDTKAAD